MDASTEQPKCPNCDVSLEVWIGKVMRCPNCGIRFVPRDGKPVTMQDSHQARVDAIHPDRLCSKCGALMDKLCPSYEHPETECLYTCPECGEFISVTQDLDTGVRCTHCGGPTQYVGPYEPLASRAYECLNCGEIIYVEMSLEEKVKSGDLSSLEPWEVGMLDDL